MFVTVKNKPTYVGNVKAGDTITNTGSDTVYLGRDPNTVGNAPTTGTPLFPSSAVQWRENAMLWAMCPANTNPTIEIGNEGLIPFSGPFADGEQIVTTGLHSRNYVPGVSGWRIGADGSVEFNTMGGVIEENSLGFFFYYPIAATGNLRFSITDMDGTDPYGNIYKAGLFLNQKQAWLTSDNSNTILINPTGSPQPQIQFSNAGRTSDSQITQFQNAGTPELRFQPVGASTPVARFSMPVQVDGVLAADNIVAGKVTITPSAANTPTSLAVVFPLPLKGTSFFAQVTANTTAPGTVVTGVSFTALSSAGITIWLTRTNLVATDINYLVFGV